MSYALTTHATLEDWIARESIPFAVDSAATLNAAVDQVMSAIGPSVDLLGFGEPMHGGEDVLLLRNNLFQRLVESHGYSAIAVESSFPRGHLVNEYIAGRGPTSYEAVQDAGFSHGFGKMDANRELIEWMRQYNADASHTIQVQFYGFDSPTEMTHTDSPRQLLHFALDYLTSIDSKSGQERRDRIDPLLGPDADWEDPAAMMDPAQAIGLSPAATALRNEAEDLITELRLRRPDMRTQAHQSRLSEAEHHAAAAKQLLTYHAELARSSPNRLVKLLGIRDLMMAGNLAYMASREQCRGKVLAFGHNSHLKYGQAKWQLGPNALAWWPAGAHLKQMLGSRFAVIGCGIGESSENGIGKPEAGTLESLLTAAAGPARFIPTRNGQGLPTDAISGLSLRTGGRNPTYFPLTAESLSDFDWLAVLDSTSYTRGGPHGGAR